MNNRDEARLEQRVKEIEHTPLTGPDIDEAFYVFAIRVTSDESVGKRKLTADRLYYLVDGFTILNDRVLVTKDRFKKTIYDYYDGGGANTDPHISINAILGENGAGKSSLVEFELRLINNLSAIIFGEYAKEYGWPHLHFVDGVKGEMYYLLGQTVYKLSLNDRDASLNYYYWQDDEEDGKYVFKNEQPELDLLGPKHIPSDRPIRSIYYNSYFESLKKLLSRFFYTVVLNQSVYAYNTRDFKKECNSEEYEIAVRNGRNHNEKGEEIPYKTEDKCWLSGLFHKNDGYQIPIVLTPYRYEGNYDINKENRLAYERLISNMVRTEAKDRVINGHLQVTSFDLWQKTDEYDLEYIHQNLGFEQFIDENFGRMKEITLSAWNKVLEFDILKDSASYIYRNKAINYLVYKTLKIAITYDEYRDYRYKYINESRPFDEADYHRLVQRTIANYSHVTNKLYRTIAYLVWDIYEIHGGTEEKPVRVKIDDINKKWVEALGKKKAEISNLVYTTLILEAAIPPPFLRTGIGMVEIPSGIYIPFEYLSSGEKQQAYTISSLVYHLKNLDSVESDNSSNERTSYKYVQLILEEVELYFHPEMQRQFLRSLLDGIRRASLTHIKWVNICVVTHSPFVLSDIPSRNVLALKKDNSEVEKIPCFGANIHEMLRHSFFLKNGSAGDYAQWLITRIAKCLRVMRWINGRELPPAFFPSLEELPEEFKFLEEFKSLLNDGNFSNDAFEMVNSQEVLLSQINMVEEPIVRRVLLDDYHRTFVDDESGYKKSMRALLQSQLDALGE